MEPVEPSEMPTGLTAGRLEGIPFPDLLWALSCSGKTGVLCVRADFGSWIYLDRGRVVFAASDNPDRRIGALLLRRGTIQLADLRAALERQSLRGERLGRLLVEAGCLGEDELIDALRKQFRDIVADVFALKAAEYVFREGVLPSDEPITLTDSIQALIQAGIRGVLSFERIRRAVGGPGTLYALVADWRERVAELASGGSEAQIIERLERCEESVEYLCGELLLSNFEIYQSLWSLAVLGAIRPVPPGGETGDDDAFRRPERHEGFVEFLWRLCRSGETGVLYASRGSVERTFHLREGRCIFATSSDHDDGLVTYLLRRGVISLRDREEAARRRLSNKRVGTLLLEMGVIDEADLCDAVRQQLGEVVWSTVSWESGDYTFVDGSLPSIEEITLDLDVEALIAEGLRRVVSWSRVRRGSGGLQSRLALTPSYLEVLDAMDARVEEWDIAAALREPRTPLEICALVELGDFSVCQVLWCLRVLGAVEVVEQVEDTIDLEVLARRCEPRPLEIPVETVLAEACADADADRALPAQSECDGQPMPVESLDATGASDDTDVLEDAASEPAHGDDAAEPSPDEAAAEPAPGEQSAEPSIWEMERVTRTQRIPREEVEVALQGTPDQGVPFEVDESVLAHDAGSSAAASLAVAEQDDDSRAIAAGGWEPPADLDVAISRFNAAQRLVYRTVRVEIGAGAANLIRSCCAHDAEPGPIGDSTLHTDGSWDANELREAAIACRLEEPWNEYQRLLDLELDRLRDVIGPDRTEALSRKIEREGPD